MRDNVYIRRTVTLYLLLHTIAIIILAIQAGQGAISYYNLFSAAPIAIFTALMICRNISEAYKRRTQSLDQSTKAIHELAVNLNHYANELAQRAMRLYDRQIVLERAAAEMSERCLSMNKLIHFHVIKEEEAL